MIYLSGQYNALYQQALTKWLSNSRILFKPVVVFVTELKYS